MDEQDLGVRQRAVRNLYLYGVDVVVIEIGWISEIRRVEKSQCAGFQIDGELRSIGAAEAVVME